jgi:immune inhibitor A
MKFKSGLFLIAAATLIFIGLQAQAVPPSPEVWERLKTEGSLSEFVAKMKDAKARGLDAPEPLKLKTNFALAEKSVDTVRVVVLLVDFSDKAASITDINMFDSLLFSEGRLNPTGSMTEFYLENSYGKFFIQGDVYGWYRMPNPYTYYVNNQSGMGIYPQNTQGLAEHAINAADGDVNFALYDNYGSSGGYPDGTIDGLFIVHAGYGGEETGKETDIISHKWSLLSSVTKDGINISAYTTEPELKYVTSKKVISSIGVFCHEYGHVLGMPDLYDVEDSENISKGIGAWSLMAIGSYNGDSKTPAHFDGWCKARLGFAEVIQVDSNMINVEIPQIETNPVVYKLWANGDYGGPEYFLVENRQKTLFDIGLPGEGLLIYHVNELYGNGIGNNAGIPYRVALEQADGLSQLEYTSGNEGDAGDPWPGSTNKRSFDDLSVPNSRGYGPVITEVSVWNISNSDSIMTANFDVEWSRPHFTMDSVRISDADLDGYVEAGESAQFFFFFKNDWKAAINPVEITVSCNDSRINFTTDVVTKSSLAGDGVAFDNRDNPIEFSVPSGFIPVFDSFYINIETDNGVYGLYSAGFGLERTIGKPQVLLVDADRGDADNRPYRNWESYYGDDLYKLRIPADTFDIATMGSSPPGSLLNMYATAIWFTGDAASDSNYMSAADVSALTQFLQAGGNLFLTGQGIAADLHLQDSAFLENYLHARYAGKHFWFNHVGLDGSPISHGLEANYQGINEEFSASAHISPANGGFPAFRFGNDSSQYASAVAFSGNHKVVFFNWGYEAIGYVKLSDNSSAARDTVLANIMRFFGDIPLGVADGEQIAVLPKCFELNQNYPNPFNPTTTISYSLRNISGQGIPNTTLKIYNLLGQEVRSLVDRRELPGNYTIEWDGRDNMGKQVASGVYFYRLQRGADQETKKMVLLK